MRPMDTPFKTLLWNQSRPDAFYTLQLKTNPVVM